METAEILEKVFGKELKGDHLRPSPAASSSNLDQGSSFRYLSLSDGLDEALKAAIYHGQEEAAAGVDNVSLDIDDRPGRLGPSVVRFDMSTNVGLFVMDRDRLNLISHSNFSSIRANVCLYEGKWQYEVQLGSKGVMQIGWATANCTFSQESGVGDTPDSFAYDGNRQRKWNVRTGHYGEPWLGGDIIGCTLDLQPSSSNCGSVEFYRNGRSMGVAFSDVPIKRGAAYFPAVSMAFSESLVSNFGATPFRHPVPGFEPIERPPLKKLAQGEILFRWLSRLVNLIPPPAPSLRQQCEDPVIGSKDGSTSLKVKEKEPANLTSLYWVSSLVMHRLGPLLSSAFVVQASLVPFMDELVGNAKSPGPHYHLMKLLDIFWMFLEEHEITPMLENVALSLLCSFRMTPSPQQVKNSLGSPLKYNHLELFKDQHRSLNLLLELTRHQQTRRHLLLHVFFSRVGFFSFINMKPLDDEAMVEIVKEPWFERVQSQTKLTGNKETVKGSSQEDTEEKDKKLYSKYTSSIRKVEKAVRALEKKQTEFLKLLMANDDGTPNQPSSRHVFLKKFHKYLEEILSTSRQLIPLLATPVTTSLCLFQRLVSVFQALWSEEVCQGMEDLSHDVPKSLEDFFVHNKYFYNGSIDLFGSDRLGGVPSHLMKQYRDELMRADVPQEVLSSHSSSSSSLTTPSASGASSRMTSLVNLFQRRLRALGVERGAISEGLTNAEITVDNPLDMQSNVTGMLRGFVTPIRLSSGIDPSRRRRMRLGLLDMDDAEEKEENIGVGPLDQVTSLLDLFNSAVLLYQLEAHRQLCRISIIHEKMQEYATALKMANTRLENCRNRMKKLTSEQDIKEEMLTEKELVRSVEVFERKLKSQARDLAWVRACIFSKDKQFQVAWMLRSVLHTLQEASSPSNPSSSSSSQPIPSSSTADSSSMEDQKKLFAFVPDYYLDALVGLCTALRSYFHPTAPIEDIDDHEDLLYQVGLFLCSHFSDPRIVHASSKDTLVQALAAFFCAPPALKALERLPEPSLEGLVRSLLRPYENRAWAQSNFILVRIWQGNGFSFRHARSPHLRNRVAPRLNSPGGPGLSGPPIDPCPSSVFQEQVGALLKKDEPLATAFINSLLNQLNWAFSEFIGMLQEIQNAAGRANTQVFIESRELKICATCFELALSLLRVLEMVTVVAPEVFTDSARASSDLLLSRLCQLLCQILNRVACAPGSGNTTAIGPGCFSHVVNLDISDLEAVDHFPMLAAVAGVLLGLLTSEVKDETNPPPTPGSPVDSIPRVTEAILSEPSFQIGSLYFLLGGQASFEDVDENVCGAAPATTPSNSFSFANYPTCVSDAEIALLKESIRWLSAWLDALSSDANSKSRVPEEELCTICYAFPSTAVFYPCKHASCRCCIVHHLMNHKECFFCKATIESVVDAGGQVIHGKALTKN